MLFIDLLSLVSWLWGRFALNKVEVEIGSENARVFPGSALEVRFRIRNEKLLPLIWLDVLLRAPENGCIEPSSKFQREPYRDFETGTEYEVFRRKFSWILWHQTLEWKTEFIAKKRGIYLLEGVSTSSGDGFGLSVQKRDYPLPNPASFVVYPELVDVDCSPFLKNMYQSSVGSKGVYEDQTLLKSSRDYRNGDSMRKINWRLVARQDKMQVNVYETIFPRASFFLLDVESFRKVEKMNEREVISVYEEELEKALSILGSLFVHLEQRQMCCGLAIPAIGGEAALLLPPESRPGQTQELLTALASLVYGGERTVFPRQRLLNLRDNCGQLYVVTRSAQSLTCGQLLEKWSNRPTVLPVQEDGSCGYPSLPMDSLRKGAAS